MRGSKRDGTREERVEKVKGARLPGVRFVLEDVHDPHNAAAILRTADALGIGEAWYLFLEEEEYNPKRIGKLSSSSANKWVETPVFTEREEVFSKLQEDNFQVIATTIHEAGVEELWNTDLSKGNIAIFVGNEHRGLSKETIERADRRLTIPMFGFVESLNVSVTAGFVMGEIVRQRRFNGRN